MATSPYLKDSSRLGDVIAAIQVMSVYKFYKLSFEEWADRISADKNDSEKWKTIFIEHPEFFRLDGAREKASLVWRRQFPRRYDVDAERVLSLEDYQKLDASKKSTRVSRLPLPSSDIKALVDTAVNLHSRALEHQKDKRWWTALAGAIGALIGSLLGKLIP
ncbi:hypothetical protein [Pseudomonas chlororaphis]|uniref:hypothetical protein n=1 Tax=Pseudomonas chlororaphis TaxID=587753 RepID=UPI002365F7F3|nr:hypothetical protein [Pseudomonas chlororaphis]WDG52358.1 hypothetical protein PUP76_21125 [Pseudomonas chlororaphis]WDH86625.1 hypothetical protein PUP74_21060 [Pseudomonas chlororaphis]